MSFTAAPIVIDGKGHLLGRLASIVSKQVSLECQFGTRVGDSLLRIPLLCRESWPDFAAMGLRFAGEMDAGARARETGLQHADDWSPHPLSPIPRYYTLLHRLSPLKHAQLPLHVHPIRALRS